MDNKQLDTILKAWYYAYNGHGTKDAFDDVNSPIEDVEEAFILLCEEHFGKDFITNWEPEVV